MQVIRFEKRRGKDLVRSASSSAPCLKNEASLSVSLSSAPPVSDGAEEIYTDGCSNTTTATSNNNSNSKNDYNIISKTNVDDYDDNCGVLREKDDVASYKQIAFKCFENTYQRRRRWWWCRERGSGNQKKKLNDGPYVLASAFDVSLYEVKVIRSSSEVGECSAGGLVQCSRHWKIQGFLNEVEPALLEDGMPSFSLAAPSILPRPLNLHDPLNFMLMRKLQSFLETRGCNLPSGWSVRHKVCSCNGTHSYLSPGGMRFTSRTAVLIYLKEMKDGRCLMGLASDVDKPQGLNQLSTFSSCPHRSSILAMDTAPQTVDDTEVAADRDKMEFIALEEGNGGLVEEMPVLIYGPPGQFPAQPQLEQTEACGSLKTYICSGCGGRGAEADNFLVCDGCEAAYHVLCLACSLKDIPTGSWYCASCTASGRASSSSSAPENGHPVVTFSDSGSGVASTWDYDHCVMCEGRRSSSLPLGRVSPEGEDQVEDEHADCAVCERLYELRHLEHHRDCIVCERLYDLAQVHMQKAKRKRVVIRRGGGVAAAGSGCRFPRDNSYPPSPQGQEDEKQKSGACKVCGIGERNDQGMVECANQRCFWRYYHIACLRPRRGEEPPPGPGLGWYYPSCLCRACLVDENDDRVVLCDGCDEGYHTYCMTPALPAIPMGKWYCASCRDKQTDKNKKKRGQRGDEEGKEEDGWRTGSG